MAGVVGTEDLRRTGVFALQTLAVAAWLLRGRAARTSARPGRRGRGVHTHLAAHRCGGGLSADPRAACLARHRAGCPARHRAHHRVPARRTRQPGGQHRRPRLRVPPAAPGGLPHRSQPTAGRPRPGVPGGPDQHADQLHGGRRHPRGHRPARHRQLLAGVARVVGGRRDGRPDRHPAPAAAVRGASTAAHGPVEGGRGADRHRLRRRTAGHAQRGQPAVPRLSVADLGGSALPAGRRACSAHSSHASWPPSPRRTEWDPSPG